MTSVEITRPAPNGDSNSIVIDGVEMARVLSGCDVSFTGSRPPLVTIDIHAAEDVRLCMADAILVIGEETADLLERHGWTRPEAAA